MSAGTDARAAWTRRRLLAWLYVRYRELIVVLFALSTPLLYVASLSISDESLMAALILTWTGLVLLLGILYLFNTPVQKLIVRRLRR